MIVFIILCPMGPLGAQGVHSTLSVKILFQIWSALGCVIIISFPRVLREAVVIPLPIH